MQRRLEKLIQDRGYRPKILVADDQPLNIRVIYEIFKDRFDVLMATNGEQVLAQCELHHPDLILLDVVMPGMDGHEVCRRLGANPDTQHIPVIFITGQHDEADEMKGFELGAVDFITKPVNAVLVQARVNAHLALKMQTDFLKSLSLLDGLTGIANRRRFDEDVHKSWLQCARHGQVMSLLMIDVDHFKRYNDHYGHQRGDDCLRQAAQAIREVCKRPQDLVARYGGEEFACVLPNTDHDAAVGLAHQIMARMRALNIEHAASPTDSVVTFSIGLASSQANHQNPVAQLVRAADEQLYEAKRQGRSRLCGIDLSIESRSSPLEN